MKTLYIIGNGFDITHKLDTSYWDFRVYLARTYPEFLQEFEHMYNIEHLTLHLQEFPQVPISNGKRLCEMSYGVNSRIK